MFKFEEETAQQVSAGQSMTCPSWKPHSFWNETNDPTEVLLVCTPAGLDDFFVKSDQLLRQAQRSNTNSDQTQDREESAPSLAMSMKALRTEYGLEHVGKAPLSSEEPNDGSA